MLRRYNLFVIKDYKQSKVIFKVHYIIIGISKKFQMNIGDNDSPLGQAFLQNPYEYLQSFIRNMNNEVFLSEYQLGHLYSLLLLKKQSPWDEVRPNSVNLKANIDEVVNKKISQVKKMLQALSQVYEDKVKKNTFNQIQRLMNIIKAKNKSIYIQKDLQYMHSCHLQNMKKKSLQKGLHDQIKQKLSTDNSPLLQVHKQKPLSVDQINVQNIGKQQKKQQQKQSQLNHDNSNRQNNQNLPQQNAIEEQDQQIHSQKQNPHQNNSQNENISNYLQSVSNQENNDQRQVMTLFYGIANLPNLSSLALGNCLEYSGSQRYIKFKMSKNYIMTIKNQDEMFFDRSSTLRNVSTDLYTNHIFSYLTAVQLFKARGVCKQWMQNVKQAWHSTFKRQMFIQLMACQFCKEIQYYYKLIQLRNPFFQKISLLMHALVQLIQWDKVQQSIQNNSILPQLKKVLIILLILLGENITTTTLNSITQEIWQQNKQKVIGLKPRVSQFLSNIDSSQLNITQLHKIKIQLLDDPFMRVEEMNSQDKTPLLLVIFIKQLTLQQILKNHIYFSQEYLMTTKKKLDNISSKMPHQKGFLQGVYKILLLRNLGGARSQSKQDEDQERSQMPNFQDLLSSIFSPNTQSNKPDFVIKHKSNHTNIYMDKATKFDIILSTVKKMNNVTELLSHTSSNSQQIDQRINNFKQKETKRQQQKLQIQKQCQNQNIQSERRESNNEVSNNRKQFQTVNMYNINLNNQTNGEKKQEKSKEREQ